MSIDVRPHQAPVTIEVDGVNLVASEARDRAIELFRERHRALGKVTAWRRAEYGWDVDVVVYVMPRTR